MPTALRKMVREDCRDVMLETATLWLAALASTDRGAKAWPEQQAESKGRAHPPYTMRVWSLNGRYSRGARQGEIARMITRTVEAIEADSDGTDFSEKDLVPIFRALWEIALEEMPRPSTWWKISRGLRWLRRR